MIPRRSPFAAPLPAARPSPRAELVRRFGAGDLIAAATLQPGMRWLETSFGAIAYRRAHGVDVTLGPPLADPRDHGELVRRFHAHSRRPIFAYVRAPFLAHVGGLRVAAMGVDRTVDVDALLDAPPKPVRGARKKAARARLRLVERELGGLDAGLAGRLEAVTERYLASAELNVEMSFINRPMSLAPDGMRRLFTLEKRDREHDGVFGYLVLNPVYDRGRVVRYLLDIVRFEPTRVWGVWLSVVSLLAERMRSEGLGLSVGFAPLAGPLVAPGESRALAAQVRFSGRTLATQQYPRRLMELKSTLPGRDEPRYFASYTRSLPRAFFALMAVSGVRPSTLFGPDLLHALANGLRSRAEGQR